MTQRLEIKSTWDGRELPPGDRVSLVLGLGTDGLVVEVRAPYYGDPPPTGPPGPTDGLWEHEVVELFVAGVAELDGAPRYTEVELGPHGHHLGLQLVGIRQPVRSLLPLRFEAAINGDRWQGRAALDLALLPPAPYRINAYAIHGVGERRRYAALYSVPGAQPDFHRLERFRPWALPDGPGAPRRGG